jgi:hypothetical protein
MTSTVMAGTANATEPKREVAPEPKPAPPADLRDELLLKFVGTATVVLGIVLLVASAIAIAALSVMKFDLGPWLPILPLSLLVILVGGSVNVYFRKVIDRVLNPKKYEPPRAPPPVYGYPYPMPPMPAMPPGYYPMRAPPPGMVPGATPGPPVPPAPRAPAPEAATRFCITCGKKIPVEARFCPYCRTSYTA